MIRNKYIGYSILAIGVMIGYNAWLIQRDDKMFDAYYHHKAKQEYLRACTMLPKPHPDCKQ
jgi:hypothetical protein